jgi:hypothetical protein
MSSRVQAEIHEWVCESSGLNDAPYQVDLTFSLPVLDLYDLRRVAEASGNDIPYVARTLLLAAVADAREALGLPSIDDQYARAAALKKKALKKRRQYLPQPDPPGE